MRHEARSEFEHLAQHDFADLPRDNLWVGCMTYLAEICAFLGDTARAATLYQFLLPYAGRAVSVGGQDACYGTASRYLGMLATTMERWEEAERHFPDALAMNARMGARPWLGPVKKLFPALVWPLMGQAYAQDGDASYSSTEDRSHDGSCSASSSPRQRPFCLSRRCPQASGPRP